MSKERFVPFSVRGMLDRTCSLCEKPVRSRGWCEAHYKRWFRHGNPMGVRAFEGDGLRLIEATVANPPDECVLWPYGGGNARGYAKVSFGGIGRSVHSVALELATGERPEGMVACHTPVICHERSCINPRHLRWDTHKANHADMVLDGTDIRGESIGNSKLTESDVLAIRADPRSPLRVIAAEYGVTKSTISAIKLRQTWKHL